MKRYSFLLKRLNVGRNYHSTHKTNSQRMFYMCKINISALCRECVINNTTLLKLSYIFTVEMADEKKRQVRSAWELLDKLLRH